MKTVRNYKGIFVLLAFTAVFSTVAPVQVFGEDKELITNFVYSSQQSGGISTQGKDGQDGEDGKNGQDGTAGRDGESVSTSDTNSNSSVVVEEVRVKNVLQIQTASTATQDELLDSNVNIHSATNSQEIVVDSSSGSGETSAFSKLTATLFSLSSAILNYVSILF